MPVDLSQAEAAAVYGSFLTNFRPDERGRWRGAAADRGGDNPTSLSIDLEKGWYDHAASVGGDVVDFVKRAACVDFLDAVRLIEKNIGRSILNPGPRPAQPRYRHEQLAAGELFRTGLVWRIERALITLKRPALSDEHRFRAAAVRSLTAQLENVQAWSSYEAAGAYAAMSRINPALAEDCVTEAIEAQTQFAGVIADAGIASVGTAA